MSTQHYSTSIIVDAEPEEAFTTINKVTKWWTENLEGHSEKTGDEFSVRFGDVHYSKQQLTEMIPGKKIVWLVTDSRLNFIEDKTEWTGTTISFDISTKDDKTQIRFTHTGLTPQGECYGACSNAWTQYIQGSLYQLLTTGKGTPELK